MCQVNPRPHALWKLSRLPSHLSPPALPTRPEEGAASTHERGRKAGQTDGIPSLRAEEGPAQQEACVSHPLTSSRSATPLDSSKMQPEHLCPAAQEAEARGVQVQTSLSETLCQNNKDGMWLRG